MNSSFTLSSRLCPVCLGRGSQALFHQSFSEFSADGLLNGYDVVLCKNCGAGYADHIPDQPHFDHYYATMSKYEHSDRGGAVRPQDVEINQKVVDLIVPNLKISDSIADIGCATGALLAEFKKRGFNHVTGFDPSQSCCETARRLYEIEVRPATISQLSEVTERFDLVLMTGVLEHLCNVESSLNALLSLLKPEGRLFIAVPDATHFHQWFSAPYQHFSMEHVNFFAPQSLSNLMARHGLVTNFIERVPRYLGPNAVEPVLMGMFQQSPDASASSSLLVDTETGICLQKYIEASDEVDRRIGSIISDLAETQQPLVIWGAGTHTLRLLESSPLATANIVSILDSNANYHGKRLKGIPVFTPPEWHNNDPSISILISSHVSEQEIKNHILFTLKWKNPIICLYKTVSEMHSPPLDASPKCTNQQNG